MKTKLTLLSAICYLLSALCPAALASDLFEGGHFYAAPFAMAKSTDLDAKNFDYGAGLKLGYDITRNFALEGYAAGFGDSRDDLIDQGRTVDQAGADAKFRQPFATHFAITESLGVDYDFNARDWFGHARAGLEVKATERFGGFTDAGVETDTSFIRYVARAGLSWTF